MFSSYEPESSTAKERAQDEDEDAKIPADVHVKKGHSWSEEVGIVVAVLVDAGQGDLVDWTKEVGAFASFAYMGLTFPTVPDSHDSYRPTRKNH